MNATSTPEAALYCQGTFSTANPTPAQMAQMIDAAKDIGNSGFTTVILGQFHVHTDGGIYYNDSPLDTVSDAVQEHVVSLRERGLRSSTVSRAEDHLRAFFQLDGEVDGRSIPYARSGGLLEELCGRNQRRS
jgi:hypothetical protein